MSIPKEKVAFEFKSRPLRVTATVARSTHLAYLQDGPWVVQGSTIIHSLYINPTDLAALNASGTGGARLYFCNEPNGMLSIIAVPCDGNDNLVLTDVVGDSLFNNFQPCPDKCPLNENCAQSFSTNDLNYDTNAQLWYKPNTPGTKKWVDSTGTPVK